MLPTESDPVDGRPVRAARRKNEPRPGRGPSGLAAVWALLVCVAFAPYAAAGVITWGKDVDGNWGNAEKWKGGVVPGKNDDVTNNFTTSAVITYKAKDDPIDPKTMKPVGTVVKSFETLSPFILTGGTFTATNGIKLGSGAVFNLNGGTLKDTKIGTIGNDVKVGSFNASANGGVLDNVTLNVKSTFRGGGTTTVKNGLTALDNNDTPIMLLGGSKILFDGTQTFKNARLEFTGGMQNAIELTPGTTLTFTRTYIRDGDATNTLIGNKSSDANKPTAIVADFTFFTGGKGGYTVAADTFTNKALATFASSDGVKFDVGTFTNAKGGEINALFGIDVKADTFTNDGKLVAGVNTKETKVTATTFQNNGEILVEKDKSMTVTGTKNDAVNAGTVTVNKGGALSFLSGYTQTAGKTTVDGSLTIQRGGVNATGVLMGGTVGGTGTVNGNLTVVNGIVKPGNSPGLLTLTGDYTQQAGGALDIELGGTAFNPGAGITDYSRLAVGGMASLDGLLDVGLVSGFTPTSADVFTILTSDQGLSGSFSNARPPAGDMSGIFSFDAGTFLVTYDEGAGGGWEVTLSDFQAVPEPSALTLASIGGLIGLSYVC